MESNMAAVLLYPSLTLYTVAVFPIFCWIEALSFVLLTFYRHLSAERTSERTESVIKGGILLAGIGLALIFIPTLQYFMVAVAIMTFFKAEDLSWLGKRFVLMSASVVIWIFAYMYSEMILFWFIGVPIFTFLNTAKTEQNSSHFGTVLQASVQTKAESVTEAYTAGIVYDGMGNTANTDSCISSVHGNVCYPTTPDSQDSITTESVERNVSYAKVPESVATEGGHENKIGKSSTSMNLQNSKINSQLLGGFEDCASGERGININMKNVHIDGEHPRTTHPENAMQGDKDDTKAILENILETATNINDKLDRTKTRDTTSLVDYLSYYHFDAAWVQWDIEEETKLAIFGRTPLMMAAIDGDRTLFFKLKDQTENYLTKQDKMSNNILHIACLGGNTDIVKYLLSQGLDINSRGQYRRTPVMLAAQKGHQRVFKVLVDRGCELVAWEADGNTVLHMACIGGNVEIVKYLIEHRNCGINASDRYGRTPIMIAAGKGHGEVFSYLLNKVIPLSLTRMVVAAVSNLGEGGRHMLWDW